MTVASKHQISVYNDTPQRFSLGSKLRLGWWWWRWRWWWWWHSSESLNLVCRKSLLITRSRQYSSGRSGKHSSWSNSITCRELWEFHLSTNWSTGFSAYRYHWHHRRIWSTSFHSRETSFTTTRCPTYITSFTGWPAYEIWFHAFWNPPWLICICHTTACICHTTAYNTAFL